VRAFLPGRGFATYSLAPVVGVVDAVELCGRVGEHEVESVDFEAVEGCTLGEDVAEG